MKKLRVILAIVFLIFLVSALVYTNIISPNQKDSLLGQFSRLMFPLFVLFSFILHFLKKKEEDKDKKKLNKEDRKLFTSVGNPEDYR